MSRMSDRGIFVDLIAPSIARSHSSAPRALREESDGLHRVAVNLLANASQKFPMELVGVHGPPR